MLQSAGKLRGQAVFMFLFHHKHLIRPCNVVDGNGVPCVRACACGTGLYVRIASEYRFSGGAAPLVAAANKKCVHKN